MLAEELYGIYSLLIIGIRKTGPEHEPMIREEEGEMTEKLMYLSTAWRDEVEKRLKELLSPEKMKYVTTSVSFNYLNCPDGKDRCLYFQCKEGNITEVALDDAGSRQAEFVISGNYDLFAQVTRGLMSSQRALMSGKLKVKGNMVKALKLAPLADRINKVMAGIPALY